MGPRSNRRYRIAFVDWYTWLVPRHWSTRRLARSAAEAVRRREAVVIVTREILDRWRRGEYATPLQLQQAQYPS